MKGCCRVGQLNFFNGFTQFKDFLFGGSSKLFHKAVPAHALPFCERWKQSKDKSVKSLFPSTLSWKSKKLNWALPKLFTSTAHKVMQFTTLAVKKISNRKNNYWNICRPGLIHDGELVKASEFLQPRHLFFDPDEMSLDFLPPVNGAKNMCTRLMMNRRG